jgi:hypothetical protein
MYTSVLGVHEGKCSPANAIYRLEAGMEHRMKITLAASVLTVGLVAPAAAQSLVSISIDAAKTFQTIDGFGTSERVFDDPHVTNTFDPGTGRSAVLLTTAQQDAVLDKLYVDLGLTRVRPTIEFGIEPTNDNADPNTTDLTKFNFAWKRTDAHVDYVKRAMSRGVTTFFLSPINLEGWMGQTTPTDAAELAEWSMAIIRRWRTLGVELPYYSVHNEPALSGSAGMSGAFIRDVIKIMGPKLAAEGFATKFVVPDDWGPDQASVSAQLGYTQQGAYERAATVLASRSRGTVVCWGACHSHLYRQRPEWTQDVSCAIQLAFVDDRVFALQRAARCLSVCGGHERSADAV